MSKVQAWFLLVHFYTGLLHAFADSVESAFEAGKGLETTLKELKEKKIWRKYMVKEALCTYVRAEQIEFASTCDKALSVFFNSEELKTTPKEWRIWSEEDRKDIQDCSSVPCKVKLDLDENQQLAGIEPKLRFNEYQVIVDKRVRLYEQTQELKGFEYPGPIIDPWKVFEKIGLKTDIAIPQQPQVLARLLDLGSKRMRVLHQMVDRRSNLNIERSEGAVWLRAIYTDHYFDSWGEWTWVHCDSKGRKLNLVQVVLGDFDLLKGSNLVSVIMRGRLKSAFEEGAEKYLEKSVAALKLKLQAK